MKTYTKKQCEKKIAKWTERLEYLSKPESVYEYQWLMDINIVSEAFYTEEEKPYFFIKPILETKRLSK